MCKKIQSLGLLALALIICLCGCSTAPIDTSDINSMELFSNILNNKVTEIKKINFDGTEVTINNADKISQILDILENNVYSVLDEDEYIEGMYSIEFDTASGTVSIGISSNYIAINGKQYMTSNDLATEILNFFK